MPIDSHSYLVSQGWEGKGSGLRKGAIARPLAIPQKRNLSGVGKDRDEAFPFWDHLFTAASKTIQIKTYDSDEASDEVGDESSSSLPPTTQLHRTVTGILSNRRPISGTPASTSGSGSSTPTPNVITQSGETSARPTPQVSLLTLAKREAAKRGLYAKFFRGPVLGPDDGFESVTTTTPPPMTSRTPISTTISHVVARDASGISNGNSSSADPGPHEKPAKRRRWTSKDETHPPPRPEKEPTVLSVEDIVSVYLPTHRLIGKDQKKRDKDTDKAAPREKKKRKEKGSEVKPKSQRQEDGSEDIDGLIKSAKEGDGRKRTKKKRKHKEQGG